MDAISLQRVAVKVDENKCMFSNTEFNVSSVVISWIEPKFVA